MRSALLICITFALLGCANDLALIQSATRLTLSQGKAYAGDELKQYLSQFELDTSPKSGITLAHNVKEGTIIINNKKYKVHYCEEKCAPPNAFLSIKMDGYSIRIKEKG